MRFTLSRRWLIFGGILAAVVFVIIVDRAEDFVGHISYPLGTWRMDLDDALIGFGTILIGTAAIWTVWLKAKATDVRVTKVEAEINGGMAEAAGNHVGEALHDADLEVGLWRRVDALEDANRECHEMVNDQMTRANKFEARARDCEEGHQALFDRMILHLDSGTS